MSEVTKPKDDVQTREGNRSRGGKANFFFQSHLRFTVKFQALMHELLIRKSTLYQMVIVNRQSMKPKTCF